MQGCYPWSKISIVLITLGLASAGQAAYPGDKMSLPAASGDVVLISPKQDAAWGVAAELFYGHAANNFFNYAVVADPHATLIDGGTESAYRAHGVKPDYDWGGSLEVVYHPGGFGRDVRLSYQRDKGSKHSGFFSQNQDIARTSLWWYTLSNSLTSPFLVTQLLNQFDTTERGKVRNEHDALDLVFGQRVDVGSRLELHPFAGLRYADLNAKASSKADTNFDLVTTGIAITISNAQGRDFYSSDFKGLGPRFGSDVTVNITEHISLTGRIGLSLLVGHLHNHGFANQSFDLVVSFGGAQVFSASFFNQDSFATDSQTRIVPELDTRLGIAYDFSPSSGSEVNIEVGYQALNYFKALDLNIISFTNNMGMPQDVAWYGPYLRVEASLV